MNNKRKLLKIILNLYRLLPGWAAFYFVSSAKKEIILDEINYWTELKGWKTDSNFRNFATLMLELHEFRNLMYFRIGGEIPKFILEFLFPPMESLHISPYELGPRLYIQHGIATMFSARKIGAYCWINQQVSIGFSFDGGLPIIGDNVRVCPGAKVFGNITIGDNAIIGANAVVTKDVPANAIVAGNPAVIIGENKRRMKKPVKNPVTAEQPKQ